ncbi:MAG: hypothetical protein WC444_01805 [Candidatus Paceibacterota bacterium]
MGQKELDDAEAIVPHGCRGCEKAEACGKTARQMIGEERAANREKYLRCHSILEERRIAERPALSVWKARKMYGDAAVQF